MNNLIDHITITQAVYDRWLAIAGATARRMAGSGISAEEVPDEQFLVLDDGSGEIFVEMGGKKIAAMRVGRNEFRFMN